jgi:hypothetical protein
MGEAARICKEEMEVREQIPFVRLHYDYLVYTCMAFRVLGGFGRRLALLRTVHPV